MSSNQNNDENEDTESDAVVLMDRFVSASSPNDAIDSLQAILAGLKSGKWQQDWIFDHAELIESLLQLLQHGTISDNIECGDEGVPLVCQIFLQLKDHQLVLQKPKPGRLLEALLDVMEPGSEGRSAYTRVLALQVLEGISKGPMNMSKAGTQWLEAPNGLHRLADLIDINNDNPAEEVVRNQALLVLRLLAKQAPMAKVFLFGELDVKLLDFCWHIGGGLTKGSTIVQDALELILELYQHTDASLQDLVWQRPTVAPRLTQLLDLRGGDEFLHPKPKSPKKNVPPLSSSKQQDADDLDDLLNSGSTSRSDKSKENKTTKDDDNQQQQQQQQEDIVIPRLLPSEEKVVMLTLRILEQLLDTEGVRPTVWKQHIGLCAMAWELALMGPPPPKPFLARPSPQLQQAALEVVATRFNDSTLMDRFNGLDRLMLLVVTGGRTIGSSKENQDSKSALGISQAALAVLRNTLDAQRIHELLLFTLAPPPPMDDDDDPAQKPPPGPTEVHKLWNTVAENLVVQTPSDNDDEQSKPVATAAAASDNNNTRSLFLSGALGGLALMLKDEESREMMFKIMPVSMDQFLETLETEKDETVQWTLLRFLCEWIFQSPFLVQSLLSSTMSTHLASMASGKSTNPLLYLLLGLALDSMISGTATTTKVDNETDAQNFGGWSRDGIFQVLQSVGISKVTSRLESLTKKTTDFPWSECSLEYKHWQNWYQKAVRIVRKRILEEFSRSSGGDDDDSDDEGAGEGTTGSAELSATPSKTALLGAQSSDLSSSTPTVPAQAGANKTLHKLLNQQSKEMEELRQELEEAKSKILVQESQLETWKRRVESTPTELDTMLNEFTAKTTDLEETIRKMQKDAKQASENHAAELKRKDDILAEQRQEAERLRSDEEDARDDRDRMEQELQGLSQAYASLEQEFRQHQSAVEAAAASSSSGAPTGETDGINQGPSTQSQGEDSQQVASTTTTGSTEVATLREEINRLRGENERQRTNAREADNWMQMAVERMNEMGATNANLQSQVSTLEGQIQIQQQAQQTASSSGEQSERIAATESQLQRETSLRQGAEVELANVTGEIEMQKKQIEQLQTQLSDVHEELRMTTEKAQADTAELRQQLEESRHLQQQDQQQDQPIADQSELHQQTISDLQQQLFDVQERSKATIEEKQSQILDLERRLEVAQQQPQQLQHQATTPSEDTSGGEAKDNHETILQLQNTIASKDAEIHSLQYSLEQKKSIEKSADAQTTTEGIASTHASSAPPTATSEHFQQQLEVAKQEAEEINRRSQEEIYKKEARIRELEDRLNSGLGGYKVEDIRQRDEEIEELRTANEAAQDWMAKAVEHHQLLTNQVRAMTEEKAKLESQLNNSVGGPVNSNASEAALKLLEGQLQEKTAEVEDMQSKLAGQEEELISLRSASSGLEQDLGISRDDLGNLQRQYEKSEETVKALEARLAENALSAENDNLRESNEDLKKRLEEFQAWADVAQTKIAEILAAKENAEKLLGEANEKLNSKDQELQKETENSRVYPATETLATSDHDGDGDIAELQSKLAEMESINKTLSDDYETQKAQLTVLQGHYSELQAWAETAQQKITELSSANVQNENTSNVGEDEQNKELATLESTSTPDNDQGDDIETHKKQYAELENAYKELQAWTETAQQRISELLVSQKDLKSSLAAAKEEAEMGRNEIEGLKQRIDSNQSGASNDVPSQQDVAPESGNVAGDFFGSNSEATQNRNAEDFFGSEKATTSDAGDFFGPSSAGGPAEENNNGGNIVDFLRKQLRQKEEDLKTLQEKLSEGEERKWEDRVAELEREVDSLQKQMAEQEEEANNAINQWQESFADAEKKCEELETKLESSQKVGADGESSGRVAELENKVELLQRQIAEQQSDDESVVRKWEDRVTELENEINSLQEQIAENEEEANNAINQWQESFSDVEKRCEELEARLEAAQKENESLNGPLGSFENGREGIESSTQDLDRKIASLENAIDAEMDELHQTATESTKDDDEAVERLKEELKQASEELDRDENIVTQWEDRVAELGATVEELQKQLQEQEDEANGVISQWQDSYNDAESRCTELEKELESIKGRIERDAADSKADGVTETNHADTQDQELMAKIDNLELELTQARDALSGDEDVVNKWEERVTELEILVKSLETQLEEQERDSNEAIAKWEDAAASTDETARGLEEKVSALLEENSALQSSISEVENEKSVLKEQAADLQNRLSGVENVTSDHDELTARLAKSEQDLVEAKASLSQAEDIAHQWEEQCTSLESQIQTLENQLNEQEEEAKNVLQQWQDSYTELEERLVSLEGSTQSDDSTLALEELRFQVESKNDELNVARKRIEADAEVVKQWEDRVAELETDVEGLRSRLNEQENEAETAITVWQEKNSELQELCTGLESRLATREEDLADKVSSIESLTSQLQDNALNSDDAMQQLLNTKNELEASVKEYSSENARLCTDIESEKEARRAERERHEAELADERGRHAEARDEIEELSKSIEQIRNESDDVVNQWTERVDELTSAFQDLEVQLAEQEKDANEAISSWEEKANDLESDLESFSELMRGLKAALDVEEDSMISTAVDNVIKARDSALQERESATISLQAEIEKTESLKAQATDLNEQLSTVNKRCEESVAAYEELKKSKEEGIAAMARSEVALKNELSELQKELEYVKEDRSRMKETLVSKSREKLEEERNRLAVVIAQLEEELREANEMIQAYVTDASSKQATELAAQGLREEIEHLRCQMDEYRATAENEKAAREASELETERLRDDISSLIALGDDGLGGSGDLEVLTARASEKIKAKERQEIDQIRKSLYRAIDELELARATEKEANEKLSKSRLQTSVCEQEIVAAKSEILFLTQTLEDMRLAEEGKRASLEYHIGSLEDEIDVLRKYNADELQNVRNELSQVSMEKDRILSQLKDTEKTNEALLLTTQREFGNNNETTNDIDDLEAEVAKLRVENEYLLTVAANDKARAERRLREMLGAHGAASEADTILEHELRIAGEAMIKTLKIEIEELKEARDKDEERNNDKASFNPNSPSPMRIKGKDDIHTNDDTESLKKEIQKLKKENSSLKSKMEKEASKSREKIESITEECRQAQAKSHKLQRQGRFDAAVKSEIAMTRMSPGMSTPPRGRGTTEQDENWMLVNRDHAAVDSPAPGGIMTSTEAFDLIRRQKEEIQEERQMYLEFLEEHEDLLALLAQNDVERACLKRLMAERLGEDAVDQAIREAEEKSRTKFGQTIRVS